MCCSMYPDHIGISLSIELPTVSIVSSLVLDDYILICYRLLYYSILPVDAIDFACDPLY